MPKGPQRERIDYPRARIGNTFAPSFGVVQYAPHNSMRRSRFSNRSPRGLSLLSSRAYVDNLPLAPLHRRCNLIADDIGGTAHWVRV